MNIDIDQLTFDELVALNNRIVERIQFLEHTQAHLDMIAFNLGARISFDSQYGRQLGTLVKFNRKTVTVVGDDGRQWRISPQLLSIVKDAGSVDSLEKKIVRSGQVWSITV